jgi:hypothetical protein
MSTYYVGNNPDLQIELSGNTRYLYALRKDEEGYLYLYKVDQISGKDDSFQINKIGDDTEKDFVNFQVGVDFFEGRLENHEIDGSIENLNWEQYRWDSRNIFYFINDNGEFVVRINQGYDYPPELN